MGSVCFFAFCTAALLVRECIKEYQECYGLYKNIIVSIKNEVISIRAHKSIPKRSCFFLGKIWFSGKKSSFLFTNSSFLLGKVLMLFVKDEDIFNYKILIINTFWIKFYDIQEKCAMEVFSDN